MMRALLRQFLRRQGIGVWKIDSPEIVNFENILFDVLTQRGRLKYLQIGGNDGVLADPMYEFIRRHKDKVTGLVIEPLPHLFKQLSANYRVFSSITLEQVAIHATETQMDMYYVDPRSIGADTSHLAGIASFDPQHWRRTGLVSESHIRTQQVKCVPLMDLIRNHSLEDVDVFVTDTEGYDFHVIEALDLKLVRPLVIRFEHGLPNGLMSADQFHGLVQKLNMAGYQVIKETYDATAILFS